MVHAGKRSQVPRGYLCLPTWRRAGKRFRQGRGGPPPVVYLVVGESRAGRWAWGAGGAEFECMHSKSRAPNVNRDTAGRKPRQLSFAPVVPATSRSPSFLRQLVARQNAGHGVGAGDVRHDVGSARGLGHGLVDAHLASARPNPAPFGCHGPRASSRARSWHRGRRTRESSRPPRRSHESRAHGSR